MNMTQPDSWIISTIAGAVLAGLLVVAGWRDARTHRIPNRLVGAGMVAGLTLNALSPAGLGFFSTLQPGAIGLMPAAAGLITGLGLFLPFYLVRGMGAGDVKLMAMVGAFLGPLSVIDAAVFSLVAGGVLSASVAAWNRTLKRAFENIRFMLFESVANGLSGQGIQLAPAQQCAGKVPYALAIGCGTLLHVLFHRGGYALFAD
jgi:prepilin peptidase CpaA